MARGRKTALAVHLTAADRQTLLAWQRSRTLAAGQVRRARIVLLRADGASITAITTIVGISRRFVYKWVHRFLQEGLAGLADRSRHRLQPMRRPSTALRQTP